MVDIPNFGVHPPEYTPTLEVDRERSYAVLSVSDKRGIVDLARGLNDFDVIVISTGGTADAINGAGIPVHEVVDLTGFPEILDGRVKTLHPKVHGGILYERSKPEHVAQAELHKLPSIDLVVVNLYPFAKTVQDPNATHQLKVENIDVGGPTLIRGAAKNYLSGVAVLTDPTDYPEYIERLFEGTVTEKYLAGLAQKAFQHTASYDRMIADYFRTYNASA